MDVVEAYGRWCDSRSQKRDKEYGKRDTFRASSMGTCKRSQVMKMAGLHGRPMTDEKRRFFHSRTLLHDDFVRAMRHQGLAAATEIDVSAGLPEGHSGRADLLMHHEDECGCGMSGKGNLQIQFARAMNLLTAGEDAEAVLEPLRRHKWELTDVKTTHPNLVNYAHNLPRAHNCQQVRTYGLALRNLTGFDLTLSVTYLPMGEGRPMHYMVDQDEAGVARELNELRMDWSAWQTSGTLPEKLDLVVKDKKEGPHRVLFYVPAWECSEQYCEFCRFEGEATCSPVTSQNVTGDRFAYLNEDGSHTFVKRWLEKLGRPIPVGVSIEDGPRPKKEAA